MVNSTISSQERQASEIWQNLKEAIAKSSGFQNWQQARNTDGEDLDLQVRHYLEETLATLAY